VAIDLDQPKTAASLVRSEEPGVARFAAVGDWRIESAAQLSRIADRADASGARRAIIDLSRIGQLDTAGAWLLHRLGERLREAGAAIEWTGVSLPAQRLLDAVADEGAPEPAGPPRAPISTRVLAGIGRPVAGTGADILAWTSILGGVVAAFARGIIRPRRLRVTSIVHHLQRMALTAAPINILIGFVIGIIIAQQGAFQFQEFVGPDIIVVDLTAYLALREIGVLLAAVMLAGRSGSAITAEIGSMKMREEIDALKVIGLDPNEILVMPRIVALLIALPLLTVLVDIAALGGGALLLKLYINMPFEVFFDRARLAYLSTLLAGLIKAPFMAVAIGVVAVSEGFKVRGSAESLGRHTTTAVVKGIFMVLAVDCFFALFFAAIQF
jgi:phospholipid/cholesterol/gamma-HCH transport system permease protein